MISEAVPEPSSKSLPRCAVPSAATESSVINIWDGLAHIRLVSTRGSWSGPRKLRPARSTAQGAAFWKE